MSANPEYAQRTACKDLTKFTPGSSEGLCAVISSMDVMLKVRHANVSNVNSIKKKC